MRARCPGCNIPLIPESMERLDRCPVCEHPLTPEDLLETVAEPPQQARREIHREPLYRGRKDLSLRRRMLAVMCWGWVLLMSAATLSTLGDDLRPALSAYEERGELRVNHGMLTDALGTLLGASILILPAVIVGMNIRRLRG